MAGYATIILPEEKRILAVINGKQYTFRAIFSIDDYEIVNEELERDAVIYRDIVARIVLDKICNADGEELSGSKLPDGLLHKYVNAVIGNIECLQSTYDANEEISDPLERFVISVKDSYDEAVEEFKERIKSIEFPHISIPQEFAEALSDFANSGELLDEASSWARSLIDALGLKRLVDNSVQLMLETLNEHISRLEQQIVQTLSEIPSFLYTEDEIEEMRNSLKKWGEYGWTIPGDLDIKEFLRAPSSLENANARMSKYCNKSNMKELFNKIQKMKGVKQRDLAEAIENYEGQRYKSCSFILFAIIDAKLIRLQNERVNGKLEYRLQGIGAVKKSQKRIISATAIEKKLWGLLRFDNIYACLAKIFENGNNFVVQPKIINRNFLDHGMMTRGVYKRDCDQLFLVLYNWFEFIKKWGL